MNSQGKPLFFDLERYLDSVEDMINADEVERAFWMLDNMPAYYRDHVPERAESIRKNLHKNLWTAVQYIGAHDSTIIDREQLMLEWPGRGKVVESIVCALNATSQTPNIMELAPGTYWLPVGLKHKGYNFTYEHLNVDQYDTVFEKPKGDEPNIFVAFEIIEHLANEFEIYQNYLKFAKRADFIAVSTPLYTINGGEDKWHSRDLGHLRTYTPKEVQTLLERMFKGYNWTLYVDESITALGRLIR